MNSPPEEVKKTYLLAGVSLISMAVLLLEISMTRIFSFILWYHYAFMMISVALLGFGVSGVWLALSEKLKRVDLEKIGMNSSLLFSIFAPVSLWTVTRLPFDPSRLGIENNVLLYLIVDFLVLSLPFFFAGLLIASVISRKPAIVNQIYFSDLAGGGLGCLLAIAVFSFLGGQGMVFLAATLALFASFCFAPNTGIRPSLTAAAAIVTMVVTLFAAEVIPISPLTEKSLTGCLNKQYFPFSRLVYTGWNAYSRIDVVENTGPVTWLYNPHFPHALPPKNRIIIDGDAATIIAEYPASPSQRAFYRVIPSALPYEWLQPKRALIIGAGGGVDAFSALINGVQKVDAVELNPLIIKLMTTRYASASGQLFSLPGVELHLGEGRNFVRNTRDQYDMIQLTLTDTWAALSSGAYSLSENYLYTVEAFRDYYRHLSGSGAVAITRWLWNPPHETLRLCTVAMEALEKEGVSDLSRHFVIYAMGSVATLVIAKQPFGEGDLRRLSELCAARKFAILYNPFLTSDNQFDQLLRARSRKEFIQSYPLDISPVRDDKPFFFLFSRWKDLNPSEAFQRSLLSSVPGKLVLLIILTISILLSFSLIILPLTLRRRQTFNARQALPYLTYFFLIGISFMLMEIFLMQKFALLLGHPFFSLALVLFSILVFSGTGSLFSDRVVAENRKKLGLAVGGLAFLIFCLMFLLPVAFSISLGKPFWVRIVLTLLVLFPLGFLMGLLFPTGVRIVSRHDADMIPWAWGVNAFASVIGSSLCVLIALEFGFAAVAAVAGIGYLAACACVSTAIKKFK